MKHSHQGIMLWFVKRNSQVILFILIMILLIVLVYWISDRLIQHLDHQIPHLGERLRE